MEEIWSPELSGSARRPSSLPGVELSVKCFIMDIVVEYPEGSVEASANPTELCIFDPVDTTRCALQPIVSRRWEVWDPVDIPSGAEFLDCVLKSDEGDVGFCRLALPTSGEDYIPVAERNISPDPIRRLWVSDVQQAQMETIGNRILTISWRTGRALLAMSSIFGDMTRFIGVSSLLAVHGLLMGSGNTSSSAAESAECLELRTVVHMMAQGVLEAGLLSLACAELASFASAGGTPNPRCISALKRFISLPPQHPEALSYSLRILTMLHMFRWGSLGNPADLDAAISACQQAIELTPPNNKDQEMLLAILAQCLWQRFSRTDDTVDLSGAISAYERVRENFSLQPCHSFHLVFLYLSRYHLEKNDSDIEAAVLLAATASDDDPELPWWRIHALLARFHQERNKSMPQSADVRRTADTFRRAVQTIPADSEELADLLLSFTGELGLNHLFKNDNLNAESTAEEMVTIAQRAVHALPLHHPRLEFAYVNLAAAFVARYRIEHDSSDLDMAISLCRKAWSLAASSNDPASLGPCGAILIGCLGLRYDVTADPAVLHEVLEVRRKSFSNDTDAFSCLPLMVPADPRVPSHPEEYHDIDEAVLFFRSAAEPQSNTTKLLDSPRASKLAELSFLLWIRYQRTKQLSDLDEGIACCERVLGLRKPAATEDFDYCFSQSERGLCKRLLAGFYHARITSGKGNVRDLMICVKLLQEEARSGEDGPLAQLNSARRWARLSSIVLPNSPDTLEAYDVALNTAGLVDTLGQAARGSFDRLQYASGLAPEAVATGCTANRTDKSIEWLEQGRCLVWRRLGHLRSPFDRLREADGALAESMESVARKLQSSESRTSLNVPVLDSMMEEQHMEFRDFNHSKKEWDELVAKVRSLPSFETFLKPLECADIMQSLPQEGAVVVINAYERRCDALALLDGLDEPYHIPLPELSWKKARQYSDELREELEERRLRRRGADDVTEDEGLERKAGVFTTKDAKARGPVLRRILRCLWLEIVKPILDALSIYRYDSSSGKELFRIWWCPTGLLSFLPIHAAGIYSDTESDCLSDYVVSSYTPTITMLIQRANEDRPVEKDRSGLFLTCQPMEPGPSYIPGTAREVRSIFEKAKQRGLRAEMRGGDDVTPEECLEYMKNSRALHLACHGVQHPKDPRKSTFKFHRGNLDLSRIMQVDLGHADFAFLSACQTSVGHSDLSEEAFHLAGGMLAAGYRRVVATMWSINDRVAARVAEDFYEFLWGRGDPHACTGGAFDGTLSAYALHDSIQKLRAGSKNSEDDLFTWVPYVHYGY